MERASSLSLVRRGLVASTAASISFTTTALSSGRRQRIRAPSASSDSPGWRPTLRRVSGFLWRAFRDVTRRARKRLLSMTCSSASAAGRSAMRASCYFATVCTVHAMRPTITRVLGLWEFQELHGSVQTASIEASTWTRMAVEGRGRSLRQRDGQRLLALPIAVLKPTLLYLLALPGLQRGAKNVWRLRQLHLQLEVHRGLRGRVAEVAKCPLSSD